MNPTVPLVTSTVPDTDGKAAAVLNVPELWVKAQDTVKEFRAFVVNTSPVLLSNKFFVTATTFIFIVFAPVSSTLSVVVGTPSTFQFAASPQLSVPAPPSQVLIKMVISPIWKSANAVSPVAWIVVDVGV